ncbi:hypothetical protein KKG31_06515 [Patescibacteria group bacterium]|nr:hypothetical protein [Patescibacteria group bacterium]MBU1758746.1 hypothetical protein [Patescibacteria group bacterium]
MEHGDFVLAYKQREDVSTICNVEKRYCNDGELLGSYEQDHCIENTPYEYERVEPISYNEKILDEYIQPGDPINKDAEFSNQGKIGEELEAITTWEDEPSQAIVVNNPSVSQTQTSYPNCSTPW